MILVKIIKILPIILTFFISGYDAISQERALFNNFLNYELSNKVRQFKLDSLLNEFKSKQIDSLPYVYNDYGYYLFDIGKSEKAIDYNLKALKFSQQNSLKDKNLLQLITYDLGYYLRVNKSYKKSIKFYKEAIQYDTKSNIGTIGHYDLGLVYTEIGDFYNAIESYKDAVNLLSKLTYNKSVLRSAYQNLSYLSFQIQSSESLKAGIKYGLVADSIVQLIKTSNKTKYDIQFNLAGLHGEKQFLDTLKAKLYYNKALEYASELNDDILKAKVYQGLGDLYNILDAQKSSAYYHKGLKHIDSTNTLLKSDFYNGLGHTYRINKKYLKSIAYRHHALDFLIGNDLKEINGENFNIVFDNTEKKDYLFHFLTQLAETYLAAYKANVYEDQNLLKKSLVYFKIADKLVDLLREESSAFKSRLFWRKISANLYSKAIEACFLLNNPEEAFYFMEKNKGLLLLEDAYNKKYISTVIDSTKASDSIVSKETTPNIASLKKVQKNLQEDEAIIIYHIPTNIDFSLEENSNNGYLLAISADTVFFNELVDTKKLKKRSKKLLEFLSQPFSNQKDIEQYSALSFVMYQTLFPTKEIRLILEKKITIVPDDYLSLIPFEALSKTKDKLKYLLESSEISYAHSNSYLNWITNKEYFEGFIGFAPITFNDSNLNTLVESEAEINGLSNYYKSIPFLKEKATKKSFLSVSNKKSILHLATHADAEGKQPPWIAFSDDKLYLNEIYNSEVSANLVVLSACNTGYGVNEPGEGIMSLARGFFYNGSKSVISSLWRIDDSATSEITTSFYKYLSYGKPKSEALRLSKLDYIQNHTNSEISPYYWSSLVLWGDDDVLQIPHTPYGLYLLVLLIIITIVFLFLKRKKSLFKF